MDCNPAAIACQLERLNNTLEQTDWVTTWVLPLLTLAATVLLGVMAFTASRAANKLAAEAHRLQRRDERRRYGIAVQAYYDSRREDIWNKRNVNLPHRTHIADAVAAEIDEPRSDELLQWVTDAITHILKSTQDKGLNAIHLDQWVPYVIASWVSSPDSFDLPPFTLWHEREQPTPSA